MAIHTFIRSLIESILPTAAAHCDTADGPAVTDGRRALETGNINHALKWIQADGEAELTEVFNGIDIGMNARFGDGGRLNGGVSFGNTDFNNCGVPDAAAQFCSYSMPWSGQTQIKFQGYYPLAYGFDVALLQRELARGIGALRSATESPTAPSEDT